MKRVLCVGHAVQDFVFGLRELPTRMEKYRAERFACEGGGPAATAAVTIARLGGAATLACRLGADPIADVITAELEQLGVDCRHARRFAGCSSSLSSVLVDAQGERMIVNYADARLPTAPAWLDDIDFTAFDAVLADSRWPEGSQHALRRARALGLPAILDADVPLRREDPLVAAASHAAFSEPALREYSGSTDPEAALTAAQNLASNWCCVTLGERGVCWHDGQELQRQPAFTVTARNTLGAGDVWHGAFALALAEGARESDAVRAASAAAALKVQSDAGRQGIPLRAERDRLLGNS